MRALNLRYLENGWIEGQIEHPRIGWTPYTASPGGDPALWAKLSARDDIAPFDPAAGNAAERAGMRAYRLAFEDAAAQTPYGGGTLLDAIDALLEQVPTIQRRRYENITIFERTRPEIPAFLQSDSIDMTDAQLDDLFRLAMQIEAAP